jgi:hypothetical protein
MFLQPDDTSKTYFAGNHKDPDRKKNFAMQFYAFLQCKRKLIKEQPHTDI